MLEQTFLRPTPKSFKAVDRNLPSAEPRRMIDGQMFIPVAHERVVGFVFVRVDHAAAQNLLYGNAEKRFGPYIWDYFDVGPAAASQNSEDRNLPRSTSATIPFAPSSKVRFVQFKLPGLDDFYAVSRVGQYRMTDHHHRFEDVFVRKLKLLGNLSRGESKQLEHFDDSKPIVQRQSDLVPPPARQVVPDLFAPLTATPYIACFPKFTFSTKRAISVSIFSQIFRHVLFRRRFAFDRIFMGLDAHITILTQSSSVQIRGGHLFLS